MKVKTYKTEEVKTEAKIAKGFLVAHDSPFSNRRMLFFLAKSGKHFTERVEGAMILPTMEEAENAMARANEELEERGHPLTGLLFVCETIED